MRRLLFPLVVLFGWLLHWTAAMAAPDSFVLSDDGAGPSCAYFTGIGAMNWSRTGGDWIDTKGALYGNSSYATQSVPVMSNRQVVDWDVTELARVWLKSGQTNAGLLLRGNVKGGSGIVDFHSREDGDVALHPMLKLKWADGTQTRLFPVADTYLDCTSLASLGEKPYMKVSRSQSALLRFEVGKAPGKLEQAVLYLVTDKQYGSGAEIGVYRVAPPYLRTPIAQSGGIAKAFAHDAGIENHPDVLFATGFESPVWITEWNYFDPRSSAGQISEDISRKFEPLVGKALRVRIPKGSHFGLDLRYLFGKAGKAEPEEIYFRYYLRFADDWNPFLDGGKMPGIAGTYGKAGWGMRRSDGYNGWSVRGSFATSPAAEKTTVGMTAVGSYAYHVDTDASGDYWAWSQGPSALLENNRWYAVEQYVKLNTPGANNGIFRAWIDGMQVVEKTTVLFRKTSDLKIESVWMNVYHGGVAPSPKDMALYIDNVVIARRYIGPAK